jgi:hypothetical protein
MKNIIRSCSSLFWNPESESGSDSAYRDRRPVNTAPESQYVNHDSGVPDACKAMRPRQMFERWHVCQRDTVIGKVSVSFAVGTDRAGLQGREEAAAKAEDVETECMGWLTLSWKCYRSLTARMTARPAPEVVP